MERKTVILLLLFLAFTVKAQDKQSLNLFTDRDLYVSGETLMLKVFTPATEQSGVVNVDLINRKGIKITGAILEIIDHQADGFIYLPDSLSSGTYMLHTSTVTEKVLTIRDLYIANRFNGLPESNTFLRPSGIDKLNEKPIQNLQIDSLQMQYKTRAKGHATIHLPAELISQIDGNMSVCIAESNPEYVSSTFFKNVVPKESEIPYSEGIVLGGTVTDLKTDQPFKNAIVYLSIPDSIPGFQYFITKEDGRFYFNIKKYYGKIPVVIQCLAKDKTSLLKIKLDKNDLFNVGLPGFETQTFPFELKAKIGKNIDAVTFQKIFNQQELTIQPLPVIKRDVYPYYGFPTITVDPHLFIDLPDFNEVSKELLHGVKYRNYNRIPTLQVLNSTQNYFFKDSPLLLVDGIPIQDLTVIKDMGTKDIRKIEISQTERFYGDLRFPGVVALYSTKSEYTRLPESSDLIKLNLEVIQPQAILNNPSAQRLTDPDLRQVLIWKPSLKPSPTISLDFQTSDIQGSYKLIIRGKGTDGSIIYKEQLFNVN